LLADKLENVHDMQFKFIETEGDPRSTAVFTSEVVVSRKRWYRDAVTTGHWHQVINGLSKSRNCDDLSISALHPTHNNSFIISIWRICYYFFYTKIAVQLLVYLEKFAFKFRWLSFLHHSKYCNEICCLCCL